MKSIAFLLLLALALPLVSAIDCSGIANQELCKEIRDSSISEQEKKYLLADIISDKKNYPDHDIVRVWNTRISTTTAPSGTSARNSGFIRSAWVKMLAVMPSIKLDEKLLITDNGEVITAYNHGVSIPSYTASGDCNTKWYLEQNSGTLRMYLNNRYQGQGHLTSFVNTLADSFTTKIKAIYSVYVKVRVKHYRWKEYCYDDYCYRRCEYSHTDYQSSSLSLSDEIPVVISNKEPSGEFEVVDRYYNSVKADVSFNDIVNAELLFDDAYFKQHNYVFSEVKSTGGTLQIKAENIAYVEEQNLVYTGSQVVIASTKGCVMKLYNFFDEIVIPCESDDVDFSVSTDGTVYEDQETISLTIEPVQERYKVKYAGQEYTTSSSLDLVAKYPYSTISVEYGDKVLHEYVHVKNKEPLVAGLALGIFGTLNYVLIGLIRKYFGVIL